jgi:Ring finger domain
LETQILSDENFPQSRRMEAAAAEENQNSEQEDSPQSEVEHDLERGGGDKVSSSSSSMSPSIGAQTPPKQEPLPTSPGTVTNALSSSAAPPVSSSSGGGDGGGDYGEEDDTLLVEIPCPGLLALSTAAPVRTEQRQQPCAGRMRQVSALCTICLGTFQVGSDIVWSSNCACEHVFHEACIEKWLMIQQQRYGGPLCPCCRRDFVVDPYDYMETEDVDDDANRINVDARHDATTSSNNDIGETTNNNIDNTNEIATTTTFVEI